MSAVVTYASARQVRRGRARETGDHPQLSRGQAEDGVEPGQVLPHVGHPGTARCGNLWQHDDLPRPSNPS
jgi:hypothetical protein